MATVFFPSTWEALTPEELANSRARLSGFIEAVPEKDKIIREVITSHRIGLDKDLVKVFYTRSMYPAVGLFLVALSSGLDIGTHKQPVTSQGLETTGQVF